MTVDTSLLTTSLSHRFGPPSNGQFGDEWETGFGFKISTSSGLSCYIIYDDDSSPYCPSYYDKDGVFVMATPAQIISLMDDLMSGVRNPKYFTEPPPTVVRLASMIPDSSIVPHRIFFGYWYIRSPTIGMFTCGVGIDPVVFELCGLYQRRPLSFIEECIADQSTLDGVIQAEIAKEESIVING